MYSLGGEFSQPWLWRLLVCWRDAVWCIRCVPYSLRILMPSSVVAYVHCARRHLVLEESNLM